MKAYLTLENGMVFQGKALGAVGDVTGEVVFNTGMTGYLETLTDPSYHGQIVVQTFPLIGNYGVIPADFESDKIGASGYIVKSWCQEPSNFRSEGNLDTFLRSKNIIGLSEIDTRALTKVIRERGVMSGTISREPTQKPAEHKLIDPVAQVSTKNAKLYPAQNPERTIVLLDFGMKENIKRELIKRNCNVWVLPHDSSVSQILSYTPDGIMLSNGPGDPACNVKVVQNIKQLIKHNIPMFGICLGHQLLALANGFTTTKMKYGHRGVNHPVKDLTSGRVYITAQNHGYTVQNDSGNTGEPLFVNINDGTCEGILYRNASSFSVQFHPEACGGPTDTGFLFDRFLEVI